MRRAGRGAVCRAPPGYPEEEEEEEDLLSGHKGAIKGQEHWCWDAEEDTGVGQHWQGDAMGL